ncbi:MAG: hypothetical protein FWG45_00710 [Oscillospiraceae bacterium]|nr:hypothetical protein [Oscillospiraceae bacterium]
MDFFTYKGHHLVRKNNKVHYGNMSGDYVTVLDIQSTKKVDGAGGKSIDIADKVRVQLLPTDTENLDVSKIKTTNRDSLYEALEVAHNWLSKAN